ncbi:hypothetical protein MBR_09091, partial [Metarhizium brunneum ARSEF 3297]
MAPCQTALSVSRYASRIWDLTGCGNACTKAPVESSDALPPPRVLLTAGIRYPAGNSVEPVLKRDAGDRDVPSVAEAPQERVHAGGAGNVLFRQTCQRRGQKSWEEKAAPYGICYLKHGPDARVRILVQKNVEPGPECAQDKAYGV